MDQWVIAYDVDNVKAEAASVATTTIYNRIRGCLAEHGFSNFTQLSIYTMPVGENTLIDVFRALSALSLLPERQYIKRLHIFKIDGALNDALPVVDERPSEPAPGGRGDGEEDSR